MDPSHESPFLKLRNGLNAVNFVFTNPELQPSEKVAYDEKLREAVQRLFEAVCQDMTQSEVTMATLNDDIDAWIAEGDTQEHVILGSLLHDCGMEPIAPAADLDARSADELLEFATKILTRPPADQPNANALYTGLTIKVGVGLAKMCESIGLTKEHFGADSESDI